MATQLSDPQLQTGIPCGYRTSSPFFIPVQICQWLILSPLLDQAGIARFNMGTGHVDGPEVGVINGRRHTSRHPDLKNSFQILVSLFLAGMNAIYESLSLLNINERNKACATS